MNKNIKNHQSSIINHKSIIGFTLIELLIVIAIIGVLATLLMVNFVGVRQRARDAQRKSDLRQIQSALEIWRSDNGSYPASAEFSPSGFGKCGTPLIKNSTTYMVKIPCDPTNAAPYVYTYVSSGGVQTSAGYTLYSCLENVGDSQKDAPSNNNLYGCTGTTNWSFTLTNP
jgi:type II secretion system protein G